MFSSFRAKRAAALGRRRPREGQAAGRRRHRRVRDAADVYLGSLYVNDFNFLGRTYQVTAQADAPFRATRRRHRPTQDAQPRRRDGAARRGARRSRTSPAPTASAATTCSPPPTSTAPPMPGVSTGQAHRDHGGRSPTTTFPPGYGIRVDRARLPGDRPPATPRCSIFPLCVLFVWLDALGRVRELRACSTAIILIVPMCLLAASPASGAAGMDNNIFTQIGFVVLAGLSREERRADRRVRQAAGRARQDAASTPPIEAARLRLRPILMTSFAFILGVVPLVIADGAGAEMRQALGHRRCSSACSA